MGEMQPRSDAQLLSEYAKKGTESAFAELVNRHTNLVYSCALRQVGSPDIAAEIAQNVFLGLARSARTLSPKLDQFASLAGWLCRSTRNLSLNFRRDEFRRQSRERQAMDTLNPASEITVDWERLRPMLDEAMSTLSEPDYDALVMRFFQNQDLRAVGLALGVSDDTAQKRVSRALDKLRELLLQRGIATSAGALSMILAANAVQAAPAGLAATISAAVLAGSTITTATLATHALMNWITLKSAATITVAALAAGAGTYLWQQHETSALRGENADLAAQRDSLTKERDDAVAAAAAKNGQSDGLPSDKEELLRLRSEVGMLRRQTNDISRLRQQNAELQSSLAAAAQNKQEPEDPDKQMALEKLGNAKQICLGVIMYANDHQNQLPTDFSQLTSYFTNASDAMNYNNQFEIVTQGSITNLSNAATTIAVRERQPWLGKGKWLKAYGFADGHAEIKSQPPEGFDAWEQAHMMTPPAGNQ
jgi:RNA polymerase sigma factor (sigma-70 family)